MEEDIKILEKKINKDYKDMMSVINSTSLPLFVEDTIEDMHILIEKLIARYKELEKENARLRAMTTDIFKDYISKSKVKEKIEELDKRELMQEIDYYEYKYSTKVLQSLLED